MSARFRPSFSASLLAFAALWIAQAAIAAPPSTDAAPQIEQYLKIRTPNSPVLAPDGTLFVRDWPSGVNQLFMRAPAAGAGQAADAPMTQLTDLKDGVNSFSLSPDGKSLVYAAAVGGNEQNNLYQIDPATKAVAPLLVNPKVIYTLQEWLADSSGFIYTANDVSPSDFYIYRYDLKSKQSKQLLAKPGQWEVADISRDGARLLVQEYFSESHANAFLLDAATGGLTSLNVGDGETYNRPAAFLPGDKSALVIADAEEGITHLFVRAPGAADSPRKPVPDLDRFPIESVAVNEDHSLAAIGYNEGGYGSVKLVSLPDFAAIAMPAQEKGVIGGLNLRGRTLTWSLSNARNPGLAYAWKVGSPEAVRPLTVADTQGVDLASFPLPELVTYKSFDGVEIPAFLYVPPGYRKGEPIPFIVNYHGGPEGQHRPLFSALNQFLLASGFGVLQPNVRGSTGYGRAFHMMDDYKKRWDSVKDGVEAARWLVKQGYAKTGKIAAYGGSYGGFMAVATIVEGNDVFGASIDVVGIVNMKTFLEKTSDYRRKLREAEYGPLSDPDFLASVSSINRIDQIKCPMLIAHGLNDPRVPVGEAMQLAVGLQKRGMDPELLFFPDEGHGFAKLENRLLFAQRMVKFLQRTIGQ